MDRHLLVASNRNPLRKLREGAFGGVLQKISFEMLLSLPTCLPHSHPGTSPGGALPLRHEGVCVHFWTADSRSPGTLTVSKSLWSKPGKHPGNHKPQVQLLGGEG